jgi:hypothetical protein
MSTSRSSSGQDASDRRKLEEGVRLFNEGLYFECHDVLEDLWIGDRSPLRGLYQGLIQAAVALHHAGAGNWKGARSVLALSIDRLTPYLDRPGPVELRPFVEGLEAFLDAIRATGGAGAEIPSLRLVLNDPGVSRAG